MTHPTPRATKRAKARVWKCAACPRASSDEVKKCRDYFADKVSIIDGRGCEAVPSRPAKARRGK